MSEAQIRQLIESTGIKTYPRPVGLPQDFITRLSEKGGGIIYIDPSNAQNYVRVMPGKIHSEFPYQQKPYVIQRRADKALDKFGTPINHRDPTAHIYFEDYIYRN